MNIEELKLIAREVRRDIILMLTKAKSGHPGGSLSSVEILVSLYFGRVLKYNPREPDWACRDRFVLSKGHAAPALYSVLARAGFFPREWLWQLRQVNGKLQGHPDSRTTPGVESSTGSLGHGLSIANGIALAGKLDDKNYRVYCLLGDGEIEEGSIWEAAMTAKRHKLNNLCCILDHNGLQIDGTIKEIKDPYSLEEKWRAFGFATRTINGHDFHEILDAFRWCIEQDFPTIIIANTIKGKGVSFMENALEWHGKAPKPKEAVDALVELGLTREQALESLTKIGVEI